MSGSSSSISTFRLLASVCKSMKATSIVPFLMSRTRLIECLPLGDHPPVRKAFLQGLKNIRNCASVEHSRVAGDKLAALGWSCCLRGLTHLSRCPPDLLQECRSRLSKHNADLGPYEQLDAKRLFQLTNLPAQRWLGNVEALRRPSEVGLAMNTAKLFNLFGLANLVIAKSAQRGVRPVQNAPKSGCLSCVASSRRASC